jgi:hypothetical protein
MPYDDDEVARAIKGAANNQWRNDNIEAKRAYERAYYAKNKEKRSEQKRLAYANLAPEIKADRMVYQKQWLKDHPDARKAINQRYRERNKEEIARADREYSATPEARQRKRTRSATTLEMLAGRPRPDVCDICAGPPDEGRSLHYDHCHQTGSFRGWLCRECNLMLGNSRDNPQRLRDGAAYLEGILTNKV